MINRNIEQLCWVADSLGDLVDDVVFLGGCTTALLVEEVAQGDARATEDVDFIVDVSTYVAYNKFTDKLKDRGFFQSMGDDVLCRWRINYNDVNLIVDVMAISEDVLGFSNQWYPEAYSSSIRTTLPNDIVIRIPEALTFIATKFCAWRGRGEGDVGASHDLEDIVYVIENRPRLPIDFKDNKNGDLKSYLKEQSKELLANSDFVNYIPGIAINNLKRVLYCLKIFSEHEEG